MTNHTLFEQNLRPFKTSRINLGKFGTYKIKNKSLVRPGEARCTFLRCTDLNSRHIFVWFRGRRPSNLPGTRAWCTRYKPVKWYKDLLIGFQSIDSFYYISYIFKQSFVNLYALSFQTCRIKKDLLIGLQGKNSFYYILHIFKQSFVNLDAPSFHKF